MGLVSIVKGFVHQLIHAQMVNTLIRLLENAKKQSTPVENSTLR